MYVHCARKACPVRRVGAVLSPNKFGTRQPAVLARPADRAFALLHARIILSLSSSFGSSFGAGVGITGAAAAATVATAAAAAQLGAAVLRVQ